MQTLNPLNQPLRASLAAAGVLALTLGLSACNKQDSGQTVGQKLDSAVAKTEQAAGEAKNDAKSAMASAESAMKGSGSEAKDAANAVAGTLDDVTITASVSAALVKDPDLSAIKINVDTKNGAVSLSGPAPSVAAKDRATSIAQGVKGVTSVTNNLMAPAG